VGGDRVDSRQDRLHGRDAAPVGAPRRTRQRRTAGPTTTEQQRIKDLEREVRELRKTNEILKLASAYFAQAELDRQFKK
jgi:transposase-like protein